MQLLRLYRAAVLAPPFVTTRNARMSLICLALPFARVIANPDNADSAADRRQLELLYRHPDELAAPRVLRYPHPIIYET